MLPQAPSPKKEKGKRKKKNDEINIPPLTRTVDRLQNYLKKFYKYNHMKFYLSSILHQMIKAAVLREES